MADALHVFTSAAVNYLPKVRILCRSIRRHHPEAVDPPRAGRRASGSGCAPDDEPFDDILGHRAPGHPRLASWTFTHSIVELSTAIKPFALKHLLKLPDCGTVLYFDPDMVLFSRVDDILADARDQQSGADAAPDQAGTDARRDPRQRGREPEARHLQPRLHRRAQHRRRPALRRLVGGAHLSSVPGRRGERPFHRPEVGQLRAGLLRRRGDRQVVAAQRRDLEPDDAAHDRRASTPASRSTASRWASITSPDSTAARTGSWPSRTRRRARPCSELISWYEREIAIADRDPVSEWPWAFGRFSDGTPIEAGHRWFYRDHRDLQRAFPDPYDAATDRPTYLGWCKYGGAAALPGVLRRTRRARASRAARAPLACLAAGGAAPRVG